jgi:WD40 repeat protein
VRLGASIVLAAGGIVSTFALAKDPPPVQSLRPKAVVLAAPNADAKSNAGGSRVVRWLPQTNDRLAVGYASGDAVLWNSAEMSVIWRKNLFAQPERFFIEPSTDGKYLFTASQKGEMKVCDASNGTIVSKSVISGAQNPPFTRFWMTSAARHPLLAFARGERGKELLWKEYTSGSSGVEFGDPGTGGQSDSFMFNGLAVSWDGKRVAMSQAFSNDSLLSRFTLDQYDARSGQRITSVNLEHGAYAPVYSPDGKWIAFWGGPRDGRVVLFDVELDQVASTLIDGVDGTVKLCFSSDGTRLFCLADLHPGEGAVVPYVRVADVTSRGLVAVLAPSVLDPAAPVDTRTADFDPSGDGKYAALALAHETAGSEPDVVVFEIPDTPPPAP